MLQKYCKGTQLDSRILSGDSVVLQKYCKGTQLNSRNIIRRLSCASEVL